MDHSLRPSLQAYEQLHRKSHNEQDSSENLMNYTFAEVWCIFLFIRFQDLEDSLFVYSRFHFLFVSFQVFVCLHLLFSNDVSQRGCQVALFFFGSHSFSWVSLVMLRLRVFVSQCCSFPHVLILFVQTARGVSIRFLFCSHFLGMEWWRCARMNQFIQVSYCRGIAHTPLYHRFQEVGIHESIDQ